MPRVLGRCGAKRGRQLTIETHSLVIRRLSLLSIQSTPRNSPPPLSFLAIARKGPVEEKVTMICCALSSSHAVSLLPRSVPHILPLFVGALSLVALLLLCCSPSIFCLLYPLSSFCPIDRPWGIGPWPPHTATGSIGTVQRGLTFTIESPALCSGRIVRDIFILPRRRTSDGACILTHDSLTTGLSAPDLWESWTPRRRRQDEGSVPRALLECLIRTAGNEKKKKEFSPLPFYAAVRT
ncbi:hypothetical protein B0J12DRAFT_294666 [Macrophomina phaseolina]|uniref:Uncharacterized protein n=1 Tax=Macrophomina phaseolina TaxID=35725 RepID=A0ABQ8GRX4_9PEZI|nr:hypothetical protein B0J12DRAFT_294666 [Macrophomina phaseolina]